MEPFMYQNKKKTSTKISGTDKNFKQLSFSLRFFFIKNLIKSGKNLKAEYLFTKLLFFLKKKYKSYKPQFIFNYALISLRPLFNLKYVKIGSVKYNIPWYINEHKKIYLAIRFLLLSAFSKNGTLQFSKLIDLLWSLFSGQKNDAMGKKIVWYYDGVQNSMFVRRLKYKKKRRKKILFF